MPFEFIDNTSIDRKARKLIRSHAAKGKNVGKRHPIRGKPTVPEVKNTTSGGGSRSVTGAQNMQAGEAHATEKVGRQIGDGLSVLSFPFEVTPSSKGLVQKVFAFMSRPHDPPGLCNAISSAGASSYMVQYVFLDEAFFYCAAAMAAITISSPANQRETTEAMRHLSHTFQLANKKLSGREALSDATMAVVIAMIQYERLRGEHHHGLIHFRGLQRMIELRGGISQLASNNPALAQKIFRADLEFALHLGSATRFTVEDLPSFATFSCLPDNIEIEHKHQFCKSRLWDQLSADLRNVFSDMMCLVWLLNHPPEHGTKLDGYTFNGILLQIGYRLVRIRPLESRRPDNLMEDMLHLGLTAFTTTFLVGLGCKPLDSPLLFKLTHSVVQECFDEVKECQEMLLWTLLIANASIFSQLDDQWLIQRATEITSALRLYTWEEVSQILSKFPWVSTVHNKTGQTFWQKTRYNLEALLLPPYDLSLP